MSKVDKSEPKNLEAEMSVLGCAYMSKEALEKASEELTVDMFYDTNNQIIFDAMMKIQKRHN